MKYFEKDCTNEYTNLMYNMHNKLINERICEWYTRQTDNFSGFNTSSQATQDFTVTGSSRINSA
jgi:hypothetical protein